MMCRELLVTSELFKLPTADRRPVCMHWRIIGFTEVQCIVTVHTLNVQ